MSRSIVVPTIALLQFLTLGSTLSVPSSSSSSTLLQHPGPLTAGNLTQLLVFGPSAHSYFTADQNSPILPIQLVNGIPTLPSSYKPPTTASNENSYAYAWSVKNSTDPPPFTFSKHDLGRNLFHSAFDLLTLVPGNNNLGPKTPYPGRHFTGAKYPASLPGKLEMYLLDNDIGFQMWYRDIMFMLKVLFDAEVDSPNKGELGYFDFQFWGFLNGSPDGKRIVAGFFKPA